MASPASIKKHPIHPHSGVSSNRMVDICLGLRLCECFRSSRTLGDLSVYSIAGGIAGGVLAAVPGLIDYLSIDEPEMKRIGTTRLLVNAGGLIIFGINLWSRFHVPTQSILPLPLPLSGSGWSDWGLVRR